MAQQIYDKTVNEIMIEYFKKLKPTDVFSTQDMIKYFKEKYPKIENGTITAHLIKFSTNAKSRIHYINRNNGECDWHIKSMRINIGYIIRKIKI